MYAAVTSLPKIGQQAPNVISNWDKARLSLPTDGPNPMRAQASKIRVGRLQATAMGRLLLVPRLRHLGLAAVHERAEQVEHFLDRRGRGFGGFRRLGGGLRGFRDGLGRRGGLGRCRGRRNGGRRSGGLLRCGLEHGGDLRLGLGHRLRRRGLPGCLRRRRRHDGRVADRLAVGEPRQGRRRAARARPRRGRMIRSRRARDDRTLGRRTFRRRTF